MSNHDPGPAIEAQDLTKTYGRVTALNGLSLTVSSGSVFGLLGPNGAGKSTAVKILSTLARADGGTARVAGFDVDRERDQVRRAIGYVSQKSGFDPVATGRENLLLQARIYGLSRSAARRRAQELLTTFDLTDTADRLTSAWSGGLQRRLDVALGLVHRPQVLFLDEPTTGLDPEVRAQMWAEIARLTDDGLTVLLTTHYLDEADRLADDLVIIDRGRVVATGTPDELKTGLDGDTVLVELDRADVGRARELVARVDGVLEVNDDAGSLRARVRDGAATLPAVLSALAAAGVEPIGISLARASLDDVYRRYAGRSFHRPDAEAAA
jgi:ABC-2 type transport system ATP-binding protein